MVFHLFASEEVQIYIYAANSEESAWEMLRRKIKQINEDSDIRLPDESKFKLVEKDKISF
jgi:hypothetical protein